MAKIVFNYDSNEIFLRDLAGMYAKGTLTQDEYLDLFEAIALENTLTTRKD